ncbi:UNVERIFIED_CONTAM: hypothetical protein Sradi_5595400 [Sesamum radiatum]|uniref:Helitron helicase-like domain-containing protein n=1 Tax=Sesamum radiatum TaxID=300843 RepID=A0AAW2L141_SESRA
MKLQRILNQCNPVSVFRQLGQRSDLPECRLIIKQQAPNQHQYALPTASQVAAIIVDGEGIENLNNRDIMIEAMDGRLLNIQDVVGYYDPLQYPLLLPHGNVGHRIVLPSSFIGSPRDMYQRYQDAMALVQVYGKPDLMLTITCNPNWVEIKRELKRGQTPQDRPDLLTRVFRGKFEEFKKDIVDRGVLGKVRAYTYVIEYQKRGLPHGHMLVIFENSDKLRTPEDFDQVVRAEIPLKEEEHALYEAVMKHMIHGPCGHYNPQSPCMKEGKCKKNFPKTFVSYTSRGNNSYPFYRRRECVPVLLNNTSQIMVDNGWLFLTTHGSF